MKSGLLCNWFLKNKFFLKKADTKPYTHLCLDGGKLHIPTTKISLFFKYYTQGLQKGERYYITECRTPLFRMFLDLDFLEEEKKDKTFIIEVIKIIQQVMETYYSSTNVIVSSTESKTVNKNVVKTGFHSIWPSIIVDVKTAKILRLLFIRDCVRYFGTRSGAKNSWDDVIDECVFNTNGIRMNASAKMSVCPKNCKKRHPCNTCNSTGRYDEGRIYKIQFTHPDYSWGEILKKNIFNPETSIRNIKNEKYTMHKKFPIIKSMEKAINSTIPRGSKKSSLKVISRNDERFKQLQSFFNTIAIVEWRAPLKQLLVLSNSIYAAKIKDSMFCLNIDREHQRCGIYFIITKKGLRQRCYCTCKTLQGRKNGYCNTFESKLFLLPLALRLKLFHKNGPKQNASPFQTRGLNKTQYKLYTKNFADELAQQLTSLKHIKQLKELPS